MSRAASGDFGGKRPPAADGLVTFEVWREDSEYVATGGEPNFEGTGRGETPALADYCEQYHSDDCEGHR